MKARTWSDQAKELGDKIVALTLMQAKELADYLKEVYGIEPAAGGAVMMAGPAAGGAAAEAAPEKTTFDVILTGFGDKKIQVIKEVRATDQSGPQGSQRAGRRRTQAGEGRREQGRRRGRQEEAGSRRRHRGNQVNLNRLL